MFCRITWENLDRALHNPVSYWSSSVSSLSVCHLCMFSLHVQQVLLSDHLAIPFTYPWRIKGATAVSEFQMCKRNGPSTAAHLSSEVQRLTSTIETVPAPQSRWAAEHSPHCVHVVHLIRTARSLPGDGGV